MVSHTNLPKISLTRLCPFVVVEESADWFWYPTVLTAFRRRAAGLVLFLLQPLIPLRYHTHSISVAIRAEVQGTAQDAPPLRRVQIDDSLQEAGSNADSQQLRLCFTSCDRKNAHLGLGKHDMQHGLWSQVGRVKQVRFRQLLRGVRSQEALIYTDRLSVYVPQPPEISDQGRSGTPRTFAT
jgi:hypothetical protein